ncbi:hypothetical protein KQX54_008088 [Cotesia glomerata]|uniref:Uncharacterized protein n=1 Tax=Cotesia glomerata TaxID=32391 RepID=A0AAV7IWV5_COTGL|nr:hypothetical protein KQX54_008088 [Cotesia glomerata]
MVKINFTENDEMRIQATLDGQESKIQLHQIIIVRGSIARFGVPDLFTNNPLIADFRLEINTTSFVELIPITLGAQDFAVLPNIIIEIDCENEE